jgi:hypothetical protein
LRNTVNYRIQHFGKYNSKGINMQAEQVGRIKGNILRAAGVLTAAFGLTTGVGAVIICPAGAALFITGNHKIEETKEAAAATAPTAPTV